jgi:hypothetical protein
LQGILWRLHSKILINWEILLLLTKHILNATVLTLITPFWWWSLLPETCKGCNLLLKNTVALDEIWS